MKFFSIMALLALLSACTVPLGNYPVSQPHTPYPPNSGHPPNVSHSYDHQASIPNPPHSHQPPSVNQPIKPDKLHSHQPPKIHSQPPSVNQPIKSDKLHSHQPPKIQPPKNNIDRSTLQQTLNKYQQRWQSADIKHYQYVLQRSCFCPREARAAVLIEVKADKVVNAVLQKSQQILPSHLSMNRQTIDYFFSKIQDAIDKKAAKIEVQYNQQQGYPEAIFIDYNERLADEELRLSAKNLRILP